MKLIKNNRVSGDLHLILFLFLAFAGLGLFIHDTDTDSYDSQDVIIENFSSGKEAILPRFYEVDISDYFYQLQKFQSLTGYLSNNVISDYEDKIDQELRFSNHFYSVANKVPIYILCKQLRISDDDVSPFLHFV
jgi:hypothetical protein